MPRVVIVVLNWNLASDTIECLRSAQPLVKAGASIVLVDNGSKDDDLAQLDAATPDAAKVQANDAYDAKVEPGTVVVIRSAENLGYAGGNNVGLRIALNSDADWVFLLNNDCL